MVLYSHTPPLRFKAAALTHSGYGRERNEDALLAHESQELWVVADGAGGHEGGDIASHFVVRALSSLTPHTTLAGWMDLIEAAALQADAWCRKEARHRGVDLMASTLVSFCAVPPHMLCTWVGDSRAYLYRNRQLQALTTDHVDPTNGTLTRAIGASPDLWLDSSVTTVVARDLFLLCSDGLGSVMAADEIAEYMGKGGGPRDIAKNLMNVCLSRRVSDNVSLIVIEAR